jgi:hypothetical protein
MTMPLEPITILSSYDSNDKVEEVLWYLGAFFIGMPVVATLYAKYCLKPLKYKELTTEKIRKTISKIRKDGGYLALRKKSELRIMTCVIDFWRGAQFPLLFFNYRTPQERGEKTKNLPNKNEKELRLEFDLSLGTGGGKYKDKILDFAKANNLKYEVCWLSSTICVTFPKNPKDAASSVLSFVKAIYGSDVSDYQCRTSY